MTSWLLRHGADPNQKCLIGLTPLSYAIRYAPPGLSQILSSCLAVEVMQSKAQLLFHALGREAEVLKS